MRRGQVSAPVLRVLAAGAAVVVALTADPRRSEAGPQPAGPHDAGADQAEQTWASCVETIPKGARKPKISASMPERGLSGYEVRLTVVVTHGAGETVLPEGFRLQRNHDAARAIEQAGFAIPDVDGGSPPTIETEVGQTESKTTLSIPFVPLASEPGRQLMVLPPVPLAVARASGDVMTICTPAQRITIDEPVANESDPKVKGNPPPQPQREEWTLAKQLFFGALATIVLALLLALLIRRWLNRPKVIPPKPKPLPWVAALRELEAIRRTSLIEEGRLDELFDRVDDCVRYYLGERYGFDGLESTTEEMRFVLKRVYPPPPELDAIFGFLDDCDLVKFADVHPRREDCHEIMDRAEKIIVVTTPPGRPVRSSATEPPRRAA